MNEDYVYHGTIYYTLKDAWLKGIITDKEYIEHCQDNNQYTCMNCELRNVCSIGTSE